MLAILFSKSATAFSSSVSVINAANSSSNSLSEQFKSKTDVDNDVSTSVCSFRV